MINVYTEKKNLKDWIFQNDLYFNLNTGNEEMSQKEIDLIQQVDAAKLTPDKHIEKLKELKRTRMKNRLMLERKQFIVRIHI